VRATISPPVRVLVVAACEDTRNRLAVVFRSWGHEVRLAHDGPSAQEAYRAFRPQAVLLDPDLWLTQAPPPEVERAAGPLPFRVPVTPHGPASPAARPAL
jgi:hypothetical protein